MYIFFITGLIVGCFIRFTTNQTTVSHMSVVQENGSDYNNSLPPDTLWLRFTSSSGSQPLVNKTYAYSFRGGLEKVTGNAIDIKVPLLLFYFFVSLKIPSGLRRRGGAFRTHRLRIFLRRFADSPHLGYAVYGNLWPTGK